MTPTAAATRVFRPMLSLGRGCAASLELSGAEMVAVWWWGLRPPGKTQTRGGPPVAGDGALRELSGSLRVTDGAVEEEEREEERGMGPV